MVESLFREDFDQQEISSSLYWFNEPREWRIERGSLVIKPEKTDLWQKHIMDSNTTTVTVCFIDQEVTLFYLLVCGFFLDINTIRPA